MTAGNRIKLLPIHVANKIAAGEIVDRPASVLKELVENAVDAEASRIDVSIAAGGRKLVSVSDNGFGMSRDDAILSIERQTTSKISDVEDIEKIATLGFRGEALAAIASVSRFRMTTCRADEDTGTEILIVGGKIQDIRDIGRPPGASVEARDIFFNVPARRKFLRSHQTELSHIRAGFIVQALSHPAIGMSLTVDGRETYRLAADATLEDRLRDLFSADYQRNLRKVDYKNDELAISGYVSLPTASRGDRNEQYTFVNGRATGAPVLNYAIREGYRTLLPNDRYPCVFLFLTMDPAAVDVNVHPTKKEVRFRNPTAVRDAVIEAITAALFSDAERHTHGTADKTAAAASILPDTQMGARPAVPDMRLRIEDLPPARAFRYPRMPIMGQGEDGGRRASPAGFAQPGRMEDGTGMPSPSAGGAPRKTEKAEEIATQKSPWSWCRVIGQIGDLYVVLETEDGFVLMDPHSAHERVLFERFMADVMNGAVTSQSLLLPETVELHPRDAMRVRKNIELFKEMGFGISEFGGDSFVVDALPSHFTGTPGRLLLAEVAQSLEEAGARGGRERWREESIAQAACKSAVKARDRLTLRQIEQLVVDLARAEMPYTCPHGRPTLIFTSFKELNKKFGRE